MATESILPALLSTMSALNSTRGGGLGELMRTPLPPQEVTCFLPEDLVVQADGSVSLLGILNTMLVRMGEPKIAAVLNAETGEVVDFDYADREVENECPE